MARRPPPPPPRRRVWRITEAAPLGEFVDPDAPGSKARADDAADPDAGPTSGGWMLSSYELRDGTVVDEAGDTVSDAQFDELFRTAPPAVAAPADEPPAPPDPPPPGRDRDRR